MAIKTILVPTDFSENAQIAFEYGCSLAKQLGAQLFLLHVQDETTLRTAVKEGLVGPESTDEDLHSVLGALIESRFSAMCAGMNQLNSSIDRCHRRGDPKVAIVDYADQIDADLVVLGMCGFTASNKLASVLLGSVAESVMRRSPCPTVIVRIDHRQPR